MAHKRKKVVIVGGGTAGWLAAGILASRFESDGVGALQVTLIESPDVQTIGVGEGTWPSMRSTLQGMGISETDFIRECDVSLKQGSRFNNWVTGESDYYYHPYSLPSSYSDVNLAPHWQAVRDQVSFADAVSQQGKLCDHGLAPKQISTPEYAFGVNYGYHLDAAKFAQFLKNHCTNELGVGHVEAHVRSVSSMENGDIKAVVTDTDESYDAELFIDCTGFASVLIEKHYGISLNPIKQYLFNDSALATQVSYKTEHDPIASHTLSTAQSSGWVWDIGLPTRRGVGYVYSRDHVSDAEAENELVQYLAPIVGRKAATEIDPRKLRFSPGYRQEFWHKNCVAIGLSAGFVEPLEATAIALVELSAKMVAEQFPENPAEMAIAANKFNQKFTYRWSKIVDFLKLHYVLNQQDDDGYWQQHRQIDTVPESLQESLTRWRSKAPWHFDTPYIDEMFPSASYQYVLYGMGFSTNVSELALRGRAQAQERANQLFHENIQRTKQLLSSMPRNREFIEKVHEFGLPKI